MSVNSYEYKGSDIERKKLDLIELFFMMEAGTGVEPVYKALQAPA